MEQDQRDESCPARPGSFNTRRAPKGEEKGKNLPRPRHDTLNPAASTGNSTARTSGARGQAPRKANGDGEIKPDEEESRRQLASKKTVKNTPARASHPISSHLISCFVPIGMFPSSSLSLWRSGHVSLFPLPPVHRNGARREIEEGKGAGYGSLPVSAQAQ